MAQTKFIVTIEVTYKREDEDHPEGDPDPSSLLDSVQDNIKELLEPYGEEVDEFEVSVEDRLIAEETVEPAAKGRASINSMEQDRKAEQIRQRGIAVARRIHAHPSDNAIEVDDNAKVSVGEDGTWVAAWVWIDKDEFNPEEDGD